MLSICLLDDILLFAGETATVSFSLKGSSYRTAGFDEPDLLEVDVSIVIEPLIVLTAELAEAARDVSTVEDPI